MATTTPQINDLIGWIQKNNRAARAARFFVQLFDTVCQTTTWNSHLRFWEQRESSVVNLSLFALKTIRSKQVKVSFAYYAQRDQIGIMANHLT